MASPKKKPTAEQSTESTEQSTTVDIGHLASILMQPREPIIGRLMRALLKFRSDAYGTVDVSEWLSDLERHSKAELVLPEDVIDFLLEGNAARLFQALQVSVASQ